MNNQKFRTMNENEFDTLLIENLPEIPPDDIAADVTPWKRAMDRIIAGIVLSTITFSFWCLDYILPAAGLILLFLGFRALKKENVWFRIGFFMIILRIVCLFPVLILNATIFHSKFMTSPVAQVLTLFNVIFTLLSFYSLWKAIQMVQQKANAEPKAESAVALIIWYIIICVLGLIKINGIIIGAGMLIAYFFIIQSLRQLSKELDETGYLIQPVEIQVSDGAVIKGITGILLIGIICGYTFFDSYPMEWKKSVTNSENEELLEIKERLSNLGFPENVLEDMTDNDLLAYKNAEQIVVGIEEYPFNEGREVEERHYEEHWMRTVYDVNELKITDIAVQLSDDKTWVFLHHFLWQEEPEFMGIKGFYGTESIQIWPTYYNYSDRWSKYGDATGRLLYDKENVTYVADYDYFGEKSYVSNSVFFGTKSANDLFAAFSLPNDGERQRGYIMYHAQEIQEGMGASSWINYTHQKHFLQYPVKTAMETRMETGLNNVGVFKTVQDSLDFYETDEEVKIVGRGKSLE